MAMSTSRAASRRTILSAAAALAAHVWVPRPVKGYTTADVASRLAEAPAGVGLSKWDLDTPALC
ncbi:hypothetical protein, partial [Blastomonas fulva]|uniref:hypothetical protein n=1 Tax=Blastomonas fulva TaxID=1550728 RepID=UPI003F6F177C